MPALWPFSRTAKACWRVVPGSGKTLLIRAMSRVLSLGFRGVQFTSEPMPGDITGTMILQKGDDGAHKSAFVRGPDWARPALLA